MTKLFFAHTSAIIDDNAKIGKQTKIWHNSHITKTAIVGENCSIGQGCYVAGVIGNNCKLQNNVNVYQGVKLKDYVFCGPNMTFTNDLNPRAKYPKNGKWIKTIVKEGVTFGAASAIVCGITIGKWAFIGAGSVVTKDIPDYGFTYGNPAKLKGWICECGEKMPQTFQQYSCKNCKKKYICKNNKIIKI